MGNRLLPVFALAIFLFSLSGCITQAPEEDNTGSQKVVASFDSNSSKVHLIQEGNSLNLIARWQGFEYLNIFCRRNDTYEPIEPAVKISEVSSDGSSAIFNYQVPEAWREWAKNNSYDVVMFTTPCYPKLKDNKLYFNASLIRESMETFVVPVYSEGTVYGAEPLNASFKHYYAYELLHITNDSDLSIEFSLKGFQAEAIWYKDRGSICLDDGGFVINAPSTKEPIHENVPITIAPHGTGVIVSAYIPNGQSVRNATMVASINGQTVSSSNTIDSNSMILQGHAYHMYVTWKGSELKFDQTNDLPDELGIGFTHLDMQENGAYGFVTGREGHLRLETSNPSVATVSETDEIGEMHVEILSHLEGTAIITITDTNTWQKSQIEVVVTERTDYGVEIRLGETESVTMKSTLGHYEAYSEDESIATCEVGGSIIYVTGRKTGETTIHVTEQDTGKQFLIHVLVYHEGVQDIVPEAVDMGLPSGTKWAPYNVGATKPQEVGQYFAWGEIYPKNTYDWTSYKYADGTEDTCYDIGSDISGTQYDVARQRWGEKWSIPTVEQVKELFFNSNIVWKTYGDVEGVEITSRINWNSIFLPLSGFYSENEIYSSNLFCYYWTSIPVSEEDQLANYFISYYSDETDSAVWGTGRELRCLGFPVRPVYLNSEVTVPEAVDLGLPSGLKWASCNVGANKPEEYGDYFAWGETEPYYEAGYAQSESPVWKSGKENGYDWPSYKFRVSGDWYDNVKFNKYCSQSDYWYGTGPMDNKTVLAPEDDAAHVNWGGSWRMPTLDECKELLNKCTWTWTTQNGVDGRKVTGPNGKSIFLPAAGYRYDADLYGVGSGGGYWWSSSLNTGDPYSAYFVYFSSGYCIWNDFSRYWGFSVRPVSE